MQNTNRALPIIDQIIEAEGGYVNNPNDKGGPTNYGITEAVARKLGYIGDMRDLPREFAVKVYLQEYYFKPGFDGIKNDDIAHEITDSGVNFGPGTAIKFLQKAFNRANIKNAYGPDLIIDGGLGIKTLSAINKYPYPQRLYLFMNLIQAERYGAIADRDLSQREFYYGWVLQRVINQLD